MQTAVPPRNGASSVNLQVTLSKGVLTQEIFPNGDRCAMAPHVISVYLIRCSCIGGTVGEVETPSPVAEASAAGPQTPPMSEQPSGQVSKHARLYGMLWVCNPATATVMETGTALVNSQ